MLLYTVLIVDDSKIVQTYFSKIIKPSEFRLLAACSAKAAHEIIEKTTVDIAVVDINLPDSMNGEVVDFTLDKGIPTIVLTGSDDNDIKKLMLSKDIVDYMHKTSKDDFVKILELIRRIKNNTKRKILIVDDSITFRLHLKLLLDVHQFEVLESESGQDALSKLKEIDDISLVLTDYEMPQMNGLQLIRNIRKKKSALEMPIIVLSAHDDGEKINECLKAGANDYIHKPFRSQELFSRLYINLTTSEYIHQINEQQTLLEQYKNAIDQTSIVSKANVDGVITYVNKKFCETTGYTSDELLGNTHSIVRHPKTKQEVFESLWNTITSKEIWHGTIKNRKKDGSSYLVDTTIIPVLDPNGEITEYMSIRRDITEFVKQSQVIQSQYTDKLTGLPNRIKLINDLNSMKRASVVIINIDSFSEINNFYGYDLADVLLVQVTEKIRILSSETHDLYKLPIDEFVLLSQDTSETEEKIFLEDMIEQMSGTAFMLDENEIFLHFSVGIYSGEKNHIVNADIALQQAKTQKKDICAFGDFDTSQSKHSHNLKWIKKLHYAINENRIKAFFQPIVDNKTLKITKFEALVRMMDEDGSVIAPFFFLDIAKKTKLYEKLTKTVFDQSVELIKKHDISVSVNLTVTDFKNSALMDYICEVASMKDIGHKIVFEIVESEELESDELRSVIDRLKACSSKVSIDDFGTGYSNFDYLIKLDADYIKIDGSIIKHILVDKNAELMVKTIINIASEIGSKTIAEFVENKEIFEKVKELGIDYSQGYYFSEPLADIDKVIN